MESLTVDPRLIKAAELFKERNAAYGSNYKEFGHVMQAMLPEGLSIDGHEDLGRLVLFCHLVTKLTRYAKNLTRGGHADSLEDLAVYAIMTAELDDEARERAAGILRDRAGSAEPVPEIPAVPAPGVLATSLIAAGEAMHPRAGPPTPRPNPPTFGMRVARALARAEGQHDPGDEDGGPQAA